jgi:SAM-dependent methyltransferase
MERVLEPEVMDDPAQALAYARADFAAVNESFVARVRASFPDLRRGFVADLGCGPADVPIRLAHALAELRIVALDASPAMLRIAREDVDRAGLASRVLVALAHLPPLPLADRSVDAVISNSLLHHLPDAAPFWSEIRRIGRPGAPVLVVDLHRPESLAAAAAIVEREASSEPGILRRDFLASLHAAFTLAEVREGIAAAGLALDVAAVSDRHWAACGRL